MSSIKAPHAGENLLLCNYLCSFFFVLTCPFKEAEGEHGGFATALGPLGVNRGERGNVRAVRPSSPSPLRRLRLPPKVSAASLGDKLRHV